MEVMGSTDLIDLSDLTDLIHSTNWIYSIIDSTNRIDPIYLTNLIDVTDLTCLNHSIADSIDSTGK